MRRATLAVVAITAAAVVVTGCSSSHTSNTVPAPTPTAAAAAVPKASPTPVVDLSCGHPSNTSEKAVPLGPKHVTITPGASVSGAHVKITFGQLEKPFNVGNSFIKDDLDKAHKHAVAVTLDVTNTSDQPFHLDRETFTAVDQDLNCFPGRNGSNLLDASDPRSVRDDPLQGNIGVGKTVNTILAFEIPDTTTSLTLYVVGNSGTESSPSLFIGGTMAL